MQKIETRSINDLIPYARNSRTHSDEQVAQIAASLKEFGWTNPILIDGDNGIIAGHGRLMAARKLRDSGASIANWGNHAEVPVISLAHMTDTQKRAYIIADNKLALNAGWDDDLLRVELDELKDLDFDVSLTGFSVDELDALLNLEDAPEERGDSERVEKLSDRFMVAPFSVLNAREGWWQSRKKSWLAMGIASDGGRKDELAFATSSQSPHVYEKKNAYEKKIEKKVSMQEFLDANPDTTTQSGTSIFDPVVCEIAYRWFSPVGGVVLDCFAGGSVRGIVAAKLGRQYVGVDLRQEQIDENRSQWEKIGGDEDLSPVWHCGDSRLIDKHAEGVKADFVFSCPPYADLEVYSDKPEDLSNMGYDDFLTVYREIIAKSVAMLKPDRFACFVVGDVRDKKGNYYNFVGDTVQAFVDAGADYYNEGILVTQCGSLAMRAGKQFSVSRKLGKTHQNILVFVKGDAKKATAACGVVEISDECFEGIEEYQEA